MDKKEILELIEIFNAKGLTEFSIENGDFSMTLKKEPAPINISQQESPLLPFSEKIGVPEGLQISQALNGSQGQSPTGLDINGNSSQRSGFASSVLAEQRGIEADESRTVKAPLVGIFYESPAPGEEPFIRIGDIAEKGQTLCLIEAMKMINELKASDRVRITDIKVSNGEMVEFGQLIFEVEKC